MVIVGNTLVSEDIFLPHFACDLGVCKGSCCVDGDAGAPLDEDELPVLRSLETQIRPLLSDRAQREIDQQGLFCQEEDGSWATPMIDGGICVYGNVHRETGIVSCAFQQLAQTQKTTFVKPISCHLYPIRLLRTPTHIVLNYEKIPNCEAACHKGEKNGTPLVVFLREPIERRFGPAYYQELMCAYDAWVSARL